MTALGLCPRCKENSVKVKCYEKYNEIRRVAYCINKGCGYKLDLPSIEMKKKGGV